MLRLIELMSVACTDGRSTNTTPTQAGATRQESRWLRYASGKGTGFDLQPHVSLEASQGQRSGVGAATAAARREMKQDPTKLAGVLTGRPLAQEEKRELRSAFGGRTEVGLWGGHFRF